MTPRDAFLGPQEVVPAGEAVGRVAAESLAAYPPGIPNVLPGERLSAETLEYVRQALEQGGSLRGASDRELRTIRAVTGDVAPALGAAVNRAPHRGARLSARLTEGVDRPLEVGLPGVLLLGVTQADAWEGANIIAAGMLLRQPGRVA